MQNDQQLEETKQYFHDFIDGPNNDFMDRPNYEIGHKTISSEDASVRVERVSDFPPIESKISIVDNINFGQITPGTSKLSRPISSPDLRRPIETIEGRANAFRE